jgi:hypothetical protein
MPNLGGQSRATSPIYTKGIVLVTPDRVARLQLYNRKSLTYNHFDVFLLISRNKIGLLL